MPQLSLYLNDASMAALRQNAKAEGKSLSSYVADLLERHQRNSNRYPDSFWACYGAMSDESFAVPEEFDGSLDEIPRFD